MLVFTIIFGQIARLPSDGTAPLPLDGPRGQTGMLENSRLMLPTRRQSASAGEFSNIPVTEAQRSIDTDTSPGSQNAGLVESVLGGVEGPTSLTKGGQGVDLAAAESGAASVDRCYLRVCGKALASDRRILFRSSQLPLWHGLSAPIAPKAPDLPATAEQLPQIRHLGRRPADP